MPTFYLILNLWLRDRYLNQDKMDLHFQGTIILMKDQVSVTYRLYRYDDRHICPPFRPSPPPLHYSVEGRGRCGKGVPMIYTI